MANFLYANLDQFLSLGFCKPGSNFLKQLIKGNEPCFLALNASLRIVSCFLFAEKFS